MHPKRLERILKERKQQIIRNEPCPDCGKPIHFIKNPYGYSKVDTEQRTIIGQEGRDHEGWLLHKCEEKIREGQL